MDWHTFAAKAHLVVSNTLSRSENRDSLFGSINKLLAGKVEFCLVTKLYTAEEVQKGLLKRQSSGKINLRPRIIFLVFALRA